MAGPDWQQLVAVREGAQRQAERRLQAARAALQPLEQAEQQGRLRLQHETAARQSHAEAVRAAAAGGCSVADLRRAGEWNASFEGRIVQAQAALAQARAHAEAQRREVEAERARLAQARAGHERAREQAARQRAEAARAADRRREALLEETALQVWSAGHGR